MQSTGWTFRAQAIAAGTTSLTISKPSGTVDGDIMLMWLTHKGLAYATMPAGWTVVQQNISGSTRGELHWKRASGEGANYSVTGLADTALGFIASYIGGLLAGDVINVSNSIANAAGDYSTPQVTPTIANTLLVSSIHAGGNVTIGNQGTGDSNGQGNFFTNFGEWDEQLLRLRTLTDTGTNNGTDCRLQVSDASKPCPDITGTLGVTSAFNRESVRICAALISDTSQPSAGTRYYIGNGVSLATRINELAAGDWDSEAFGPHIYIPPPVSLLTQDKTLAWHVDDNNWVTNRQGNYDELLFRYVTPPLEAQTISGTIDISLKVQALWLSTLGLTSDTVARYKVHAYTTVGQTGVVRDVLLNNYVDSIDFPKFSGSQTWRGLAAAQALTPSVISAGDTVIVELGVRIVSSPTPTPTYPPTEYSRLLMTGFGGTFSPSNGSTGVGMQDAVNGTTTSSRCGWIDFSDTIVEQAVPSPPANSTYAGRTVIPATLPYQSAAFPVEGSLSNARTVWFEWTPDASGNVGIYTFGSVYRTQIVVLTGTPGSFVAVPDYQVPGGTASIQRGTTAFSFDASLGTPYIIGVYLSSLVPAAAGELRLTMTFRDVVPAEGDLYIPNGEIFVYRNGLPFNWSALNFLPSGCVIDYSLLPLIDIEDGSTHTDLRLCLNLFGGSALTEILDLATLDRDTLEVDFIFEAYSLAGDPQNAAALAFDRVNDRVLTFQWGSGFLDVNDAGTTGSIAAYFNDVSEFATESAVYRTSIQNGDNTGFFNGGVIAAESFANLTVDATTPWYGAIADADPDILYYVSDGFYITPRTPPGSFVIRVYNLATTTQLPNLITIPASSSVAAGSGLHGLCVHSDNTLFVCNGNTVVRVDIASGTILTTYTAVGDYGYDGQDLYDVHVTPDGASIIAIDGQTMTVFQWDIDSGVQTSYFQTWMVQGSFTQFAIFQPNPLPPPPSECPGDRTGTFEDGLPYTPVEVAPCGGTGDRSGQQTGQ